HRDKPCTSLVETLDSIRYETYITVWRHESTRLAEGPGVDGPTRCHGGTPCRWQLRPAIARTPGRLRALHRRMAGALGRAHARRARAGRAHRHRLAPPELGRVARAGGPRGAGAAVHEPGA